MTAELYEIVARLGLAVTAGAALGLNRWLHQKPAGMRTHALVALGAAMATMLVSHAAGADAQSLSRVIQGLITGVGFIGAGVIMRAVEEPKISGLTTAATIWASAILGITCGVADYTVGTVGLVFALLILTVGLWVEDTIEKFFKRH